MIKPGTSWPVWTSIAALIALCLALQGPGSASAAFKDSDGDGAIDAAELIAGSDPDDPASGPESAGGSVYLNRPLCTDGADNDLDGLVDAADPGCVDTDGDFVDDPVELALGSDPNNFDSIPESALIDEVLASLGFITFLCTDSLDNDLDGVVDAADTGCVPIDTDGDGYADVIEKTYGSDPNDAGSQPEDEEADPALCTDGADNDLDGLVDGDDPGCEPRPAATPTVATATTPVPAATSVAVLPATGSGPRQDSSAALRFMIALAVLGGLVAGARGVAHVWLDRQRSRR